MSKLGFDGDNYYNTETGEIYTQRELNRYSEEALFNEFKRYCERHLDFGTDIQFDLIKKSDKESTKTRVKGGHFFNMMHTTDLRELILSGEFSKKEGCFIGLITPFIEFPYNDIRVKKEYLSLKELGEVVGYGINAMTEIVKGLEEKQVIKVVWGGNKPPIIYFNPFLYSSGRNIDNEVVEMFIDSPFNPRLFKK